MKKDGRQVGIKLQADKLQGMQQRNLRFGVPVERNSTIRIPADLTTTQRCKSLNTLGYEDQVEGKQPGQKIATPGRYPAVQSSAFEIRVRENAGRVIRGNENRGNGTNG